MRSVGHTNMQLGKFVSGINLSHYFVLQLIRIKMTAALRDFLAMRRLYCAGT